MPSIGDRIREKRKALNLTQPQLADKAMVSRGSISFWENNINVPKSQNLLNLALVLRTTPQYIIEGKDPEPPAALRVLSGDGEVDPQLITVWQILTGLDKGAFDALVSFLLMMNGKQNNE